jgi:hypothetical protein
MKTLPNILVYSYQALDATHGTGTIFSRNFARYPKHQLQNICLRSTSVPIVERIIELNPELPNSSKREHLRNKLVRRLNPAITALTGKTLLSPIDWTLISKKLSTTVADFDLIYAICHNVRDMIMVKFIKQTFDCRFPLIVHLHDFFPSSHFGMARSLKRLSPDVTEFWAVTASIANYVEKATQRTVSIDPQFYSDISHICKSDYTFTTDFFRPCVLGNIWQPELLRDLKCIWSLAKASLANLQPIAWHCHPSGVDRIRAAGIEPLPEIVPASFLAGSDLAYALASYDLSIVPFSRFKRAHTDYERFSMPSRMTEAACAGLPTLLLAGPDAPLAKYVDEKNIGLSVPASNHEQAAFALCNLGRDQASREAYGRAARRLAEKEFSLAERQDHLYATLSNLAGLAE